MKKLSILLILILSFSFNINTKAETYDTWVCLYGSYDIEFGIYLDEDMKVTNTYQGVGFSAYDFSDVEGQQVPDTDPEKDNGKCPEKMYINNPGSTNSAVMSKSTGDISFEPNASECGYNKSCYEYTLYTEELTDDEKATIAALASVSTTTISLDGVETTTPKQVTADDTDPAPAGEITCESKYDNIIDNYTDSLSKKDGSSYKYETQAKEYCSNVLKLFDYSTEPDCIKKCVKVSEDLKTIKEENVGTTDTPKCYLSDDARSFLKNIVKWVKLILPVLLIVLSIFDFLRAIANEDEGMKRAKKHLINRLIALAILYTLPSFIQFFLERFGFVYKECEIFMIKLLK